MVVASFTRGKGVEVGSAGGHISVGAVATLL